MQDQSTLFPADSPASRLVLPGSEKARKMTATSGQKCSASYKKSSRLGLLVRTLLESSTWCSTRCYLTWKVLATNQRRSLYRLVPRTRRTEGIEYGLLPTADANMGNRGALKNTNLYRPSGHRKQKLLNDVIAQLLLTPTASEHEQDVEKFKERMSKYPNGTTMPNLATQIKMLPTPTTSGFDLISKDCGKSQLHEVVGTRIGMKLQPAFVEWMMGYPDRWTELTDSKPSETQSFRKSHTKSSAQ